MENQGSLYDQFTGNEPVSIAPINQSHLYEQSDTPFANRQDLAQPYSSEFNKKCDNAKVDSKPKTNARYEWALLIANRDSSNPVALKVNMSFVRNNINGQNFPEEKDRYMALYKQLDI